MGTNTNVGAASGVWFVGAASGVWFVGAASGVWFVGAASGAPTPVVESILVYRIFPVQFPFQWIVSDIFTDVLQGCFVAYDVIVIIALPKPSGTTDDLIDANGGN